MKSYEELRKVHEEIHKINLQESEETVREKEEMLLEAVKRIKELNNIARREGLLALEEAVVADKSIPVENFLRQFIILIVDGTDESDVINLGWSRYYSSLVTDYEALQCLIYLEGVLSIQAGNNPRVLEEKLNMMLPNSLYRKYCQEKEKELEDIWGELE